MAGCAACGADNVGGARFCQRCGAALVSADDGLAAGARKVVTVVFADVAGFTGSASGSTPNCSAG